MSALRAPASKGGERIETHIEVIRPESYISALHCKSVLQRGTDVKRRQTVIGACQFGVVTSNLLGSHSDASIHPLLQAAIHFINGFSY